MLSQVRVLFGEPFLFFVKNTKLTLISMEDWLYSRSFFKKRAAYAAHLVFIYSSIGFNSFLSFSDILADIDSKRFESDDKVLSETGYSLG